MGVLVTNSPLEVRLEKEFVTRREFERLESNMNSHVAELKGIVAVNSTEMKSLFMQTMASVAAQNTSLTNKVERSNKTLSDKIEQVANGAWQGRKDLWVQVNTQREDLGALKATSNVADQIGKLAEAINPQQTRVQPTHSNPASKA